MGKQAMSVYRVFIKEICYLDVEAESTDSAAEIAMKAFNDEDSAGDFELLGVGVHVLPYEDWPMMHSVVH